MKTRFYAGTEDGRSLSIRRVDESFHGATVFISFRTVFIIIVLAVIFAASYRFVRHTHKGEASISNEENYAVKNVQTVSSEIEEKKGIVFPESSTSLLSEKDIEILKAGDDFQNKLRAAINEIYARNNLDFEKESITEYYLQFDWYNPVREEVPWEDFNTIEQANLALLIRVEEEFGFR